MDDVLNTFPASRTTSKPAPSPAIRRVRSLWPKEHGAYGQLGMPLLGAIIAGFPPRPASIGFLAAAVAIFLAHEPALLLLGQRGKRALDEAGDRARQRLLILTIVAAPGGIGGLVLAVETWWSVLVAAVFATAAVLFVFTGREKTAAGELVAGTALPWCGVPVALASGVPVETALVHWAVWSVAFASATLSVRGMIARGRKRRRSLVPAFTAMAFSLAAVALALGLGIAGWVGIGPVLALLPLVIISLGIGIVAPRPKHLRKVGWLVMASSVLTLLILSVTPALAG